MRFSVIGGDGRSVALCGLLLADGHEVRTFALEQAALPPGVFQCASPEEAARDASCTVLPLPASSAKGLLNAPKSREPVSLGAVLAALPPGTPVLAGRADGVLRSFAGEQGKPLYDYFGRETLQIKNAAATAEGAVEVLIRETEGILLGSRMLMIGFGRIGTLLARRLQGLGVRVAVSSRSPEDMAWCACLGYETLDTRALSGRLGGFAAVVNTVPAPVLGEALLSQMNRETLCLDLASLPGGIDLLAAERLGLRALRALGLPGKTAPAAAAGFIRDAIYEILEEIGVGG